jgi:hypothetical protein
LFDCDKVGWWLAWEGSQFRDKRLSLIRRAVWVVGSGHDGLTEGEFACHRGHVRHGIAPG